jgi:hypothetical protein
MSSVVRPATLLLSLLGASLPEALLAQEIHLSPMEASGMTTHHDPGADHAAARAREETGGRVLDVRPVQEGLGDAYEVRILLDEGRVRRIRVDSAAGQER